MVQELYDYPSLMCFNLQDTDPHCALLRKIGLIQTVKHVKGSESPGYFPSGSLVQGVHSVYLPGLQCPQCETLLTINLLTQSWRERVKGIAVLMHYSGILSVYQHR